MNQSELKRNTCTTCQVQENACKQVTIGFNFPSDWLRKWQEFFLTNNRADKNDFSKLDWQLLCVVHTYCCQKITCHSLNSVILHHLLSKTCFPWISTVSYTMTGDAKLSVSPHHWQFGNSWPTTVQPTASQPHLSACRRPTVGQLLVTR